MIELTDILKCPNCGNSDFKIGQAEVNCGKCNNKYKVEDGMPLMFHENSESTGDVTDKIKAFYEKTPFPNYDGFEGLDDLIQRARTGIFARLLNEQTPYRIRVLEVGCGTGQLSNYLGIAHRYVFGTDMCLNSLRMANDFKNQNNLDRVKFFQMNLFNPVFKDESFQLVISNGVLHHTGDPYGGFEKISKLVKKGGYIIIGLYNKYGRIPTDIRRIVFKLFNDRFKMLDSRLVNENVGKMKKLAWFLDQYKNPHESKHTIDEVLGWFSKCGFEFVNAIPSLDPFENLSQESKLFKKHGIHTKLERLMVQMQLIFTGVKEGGFYIMIGKRNK